MHFIALRLRFVVAPAHQALCVHMCAQQQRQEKENDSAQADSGALIITHTTN